MNVIGYAIVAGAVQGQLTFFGMWDNGDDAIEWAKDEMRHEHWELVPIHSTDPVKVSNT